jgi:hypothetical protein
MIKINKLNIKLKCYQNKYNQIYILQTNFFNTMTLSAQNKYSLLDYLTSFEEHPR